MEVVMATMMKTLMRNGMLTIEMMMKKMICNDPAGDEGGSRKEVTKLLVRL